MVGVGFTGTQLGMTENQKSELTEFLESYSGEKIFHHGDCIGADAQAHSIARDLGYRVIIHPPTNPVKRAFCTGDEVRVTRDYLDRNKLIVLESEFMLAAPKSLREELRSGTWSTVRYTRKLNRPHQLLTP